MARKKKSNSELIDGNIATLQKATKSDIPFLIGLHDELCQRSRIYYLWHRHPISESIHWLIFTLIVLLALLFNLKLNYYILMY